MVLSLSLEDARNIATVVAAGLAAIGIVPLFRNLAASQRNLRSKIYFDTLSLLEGKDDEIRNLRHVLENGIRQAKNLGRPFDILAEPDGVRGQLDQLARTYDKVGLLVKHGVIPIDFLFDFYSRPIVLAWTHINPLVSQVRVARTQPGHLIKFQILAVGAALDRAKKYGESLPFPISREDVAMWRSWSSWQVRWFWTRQHRA